MELKKNNNSGGSNELRVFKLGTHAHTHENTHIPEVIRTCGLKQKFRPEKNSNNNDETKKKQHRMARINIKKLCVHTGQFVATSFDQVSSSGICESLK